MKMLMRRMLKALWRSTEGLRRPILFRLENFMRRCLQPSDAASLSESDVLMDHMVRELVRLQCQVERLQQTIVELLPAQEGSAIAGEIEPGSGTQEQLKAG